MSTLPPTAILLVKDNQVLGHFEDYAHVGMYFGITINDEGVIKFRGEKMNPTYILDTDPAYDWMMEKTRFNKFEAVRDWCRHHMPANLPFGCHIYRYLR